MGNKEILIKQIAPCGANLFRIDFIYIRLWYNIQINYQHSFNCYNDRIVYLEDFCRRKGNGKRI
jgi:hypothetical protein